MPGVSSRFFPASRARLIAATGVLGFATKKDDCGTEEPASEPVRKFGPLEFCWADGTKTLNFPLELVYRNGSSSVAGLCGSAVTWSTPMMPSVPAGLLPKASWLGEQVVPAGGV